jgi:LysR family transcriptional regulator, nitrogen assimilation regulatory protein
MDVRQLKYFLRIVELKSFSEASKHLRIAQPALGLQVRKLEDELGVSLLDRHARGVTPTAAGLLLYEHADIILRQVERARSEVVDIAVEPRGKIAIGLTMTVSLVLGAALVERYHAVCPHVSLRVVDGLSELLVEWVETDRLDMAFTYNTTTGTGLVHEPLAVEDLFLVGPANTPELAQPTVPFEFLTKVPLVLPSPQHVLRTFTDDAANAIDKPLNVAFEIDSVQTMKELVERSIGFTVLPFGAVQAEVSEGRLSASRVVQPDLSRTLCVVYSRRRPSSKAFTTLHQLIRKLVAERLSDKTWSWRPVAA